MDRIDAMRLFVRVAEQGSFSAGARALRVKQSTASKWVAELERQLGVALVERTTRALRLTAAGHVFRARAVDVLAGYDALSGELAQANATPTGRVRITAPVVFGRLFVVPPLVAFLARHPLVEAEIVLSDRYVNLVEEGFDLAVRVGVPADTSARGRKVADRRRVLVASTAYVRRHGAPQDVAALSTHQCIMHGEGGAMVPWRLAQGQGRTRQVPAQGRIVVNNSEVALEMVRGGLGIALLADWLVREDLAKKKLVRLLADYEPTGAPVYVLTPPGKYTSAAVRALLGHLGASLGSLPPA